MHYWCEAPILSKNRKKRKTGFQYPTKKTVQVSIPKKQSIDQSNTNTTPRYIQPTPAPIPETWGCCCLDRLGEARQLGRGGPAGRRSPTRLGAGVGSRPSDTPPEGLCWAFNDSQDTGYMFVHTGLFAGWKKITGRAGVTC